MNDGYSRHERPQILLLGNGINLAYANSSYSWEQLLDKMTVVADRPDYDSHAVPFPLDIVIRTDDNVDEQLKEFHKEMYGNIDNEEYMDKLHTLLNMKFDHILTTNYSYELESACTNVKTVSDNILKTHQNHSRATEKAEPKYLLHTFYEFTFGGYTNNIWHIHGEARKYQSVIIGHYYYGKLLSKFINFFEKRGNYYQKTLKNGQNPDLKSWLDAFILGDVYILGQGLDFSEMDLWWLINRKKREKAEGIGKIYFYDPLTDGNKVKKYLLGSFDCETIDFSITIKKKEGNEEDKKRIEKENSEKYKKFYELALCDIKSKLEEKLLR